MKKGEPIIKGKEALADAYADCYSDKPLDRWQALHDGYFQGYKDAEKDLGWHSVDESLPPKDEEVIVLTEVLNLGKIYELSFAHIVDKNMAVDYNGWNIPGVRYWMPMPKITEEEL